MRRPKINAAMESPQTMAVARICKTQKGIKTPLCHREDFGGFLGNCLFTDAADTLVFEVFAIVCVYRSNASHRTDDGHKRAVSRADKNVYESIEGLDSFSMPEAGRNLQQGGDCVSRCLRLNLNGTVTFASKDAYQPDLKEDNLFKVSIDGRNEETRSRRH